MIRPIYIFLSLLLLLAGNLDAQAQRRGSQTVKKEQRDANQRLNDTRQQVSANKQELSAQLDQLNAINAQIELITRQIEAGEAESRRLEAQITAVNDTIRQLEDDIRRLKESAKKSLRQARSQRQSMSATNLVFSSQNFTQATKRIGYLRQLDRSRLKKTRSLREAEAALNLKKQELARLIDNQRHLLAQLKESRALLETNKKEMQRLVASLRRQGKQLDRELRQRRDQVALLDRELEQAIAEEARLRAEEEARKKAEEEARLRAEEEARKKAEEERQQAEAAAAQPEVAQATPTQPDKPQSGKKQDKKKKKDRRSSKNKGGSTAPAPSATPTPTQTPTPASTPTVQPSAPALSGSFANNKGKLPYPVSGKYTIVGMFGRNKHADFSRVEVENSGIDIQTAPGADAKAVFDGEVSSIFQLGSYHNIVMVRHGEYLTVYANIDKLNVRKGEKVRAGQSIGSIFSDPDNDNRTVLHFEVRKEREKENPMDWLKRP